MFRVWYKIFLENRMIKDTVIIDEDLNKSRTRKIFDSLDKVCYEFDLSVPIWLDSTIEEFKRFDKVRFTKDNFMDPIDFDYLELHVIEED